MRVNRDLLLKELEAVTPGLSAKEQIEQSNCFVFSDGQVITFNDEVAARFPTCMDLTCAVQAAPLLSLLKKLKEDDLNITLTEGELLVSGKKKKSGIRAEAEILLPLESLETPKKWKPVPEDFGTAVSMVSSCASRDESHFALTCIHVHPEWVEACDNAQAGRYNIMTGVREEIVIRKDSLKNIQALDMTEFSETRNWIHFRNPSGLILSCRRFVEDYPDISKSFDVDGEKTVLPKDIKDAVERAEVFSIENIEDKSIEVHLRPGAMKIKGEGASGWFSEIKHIQYEGHNISFRIAPKLLVDLAKNNQCEITEGRLKVKQGKMQYVTCLMAAVV